jgi:hypothetical protein
MTKNQLKTISFFLTIFILLPGSIMGANETIVMSRAKKTIKKIPAAVVPYGESRTLTLTGFHSRQNRKEVTCSLSFANRKNEKPFTVVLFVSCGEYYLVMYFDENSKFFILNKTGKWVTDLNTKGMAIKGKNKGVITLTFEKVKTTVGQYGIQKKVYSLDRKKGTVFAFTVNGEIKFINALPGEQKDHSTFFASSNVVKKDVCF